MAKLNCIFTRRYRKIQLKQLHLRIGSHIGRRRQHDYPDCQQPRERQYWRPNQYLRSIKWNNTEGVLLADEYDVDKIDTNGDETHFINYNAGTDFPVYGICDDGTTAYWVTNDASGGGKATVYKKALIGNASTSATTMFASPSIVVSDAVMEFVKERIVMCVNNAVYEFAPNAGSFPTAVYSHPSSIRPW